MRFRALAVLLCASAFRPDAAHAAAAEESLDEQPARDVEVIAAGDPDVVEALEQRLRALLRGFPVVVHFRRAKEFRPRDVFVTSPNPALARIWLDARGSTRAVLYLVDDAHERFLVRVVPLEAGYDEVARESVGTIVQSSIEALLAGASVGVSRQDAEAQVEAIEPQAAQEPASEQPATLPPRVNPRLTDTAPRHTRDPSPSLLALVLGYGARAMSDAPELLHGPELGVIWGSAPGRGMAPRVRLELGYRFPLEWVDAGVGAQFQGAGARAAVGVAAGLSPDATLGLWLGGGVDWLHVAPQVTGNATRAYSPFEVLAPTFAADAELGFRLTRTWGLTFGLGAERDLLGNHFDVLRDGQRHTALRPWVVWPKAYIGFAWRP